MTLCLCGCGLELPADSAAQRRFLNPTHSARHRQRARRARLASLSAPLVSGAMTRVERSGGPSEHAKRAQFAAEAQGAGSMIRRRVGARTILYRKSGSPRRLIYLDTGGNYAETLSGPDND